MLFPFLEAGLIDGGVHAALSALLSHHRPFEAGFDRCGRFPGELYLAPAPEPATRFRSLTEAIAERWPENPPFGGAFGDTVDLLVHDGRRWERRASFPLGQAFRGHLGR